MAGVAVAPSSAAPPRRARRGGGRSAIQRTFGTDDGALALAANPPALAASDPESLLLARCAAQIAAEAGAGASVHAIAAPRQAQLLRDALAALAPAVGGDRRREIVYLPRTAVALLDTSELLALLRGLAARHLPGALLVVAVATSSQLGHATSPSARRATGCNVRVVEHLARAAGWETCQLWTDGTGRHALVVVERVAAASVKAS